MPTELAFFLSIPEGPSDRPYTVTDKFGPTASGQFNYGISVTASEPVLLRAVCPGWLWFDPATLALRLVPTIKVRANAGELVTAFLYKGVNGVLESLIHAEFSRHPLADDEQDFTTEVLNGAIGIEILAHESGSPIALASGVEFVVESSHPIRPYSGQPNFCDPASFWQFALSQQQVMASDLPFVTAYIQENFAGRCVLEIRDEYNAPITAPRGVDDGLSAPGASDIVIRGVATNPVRGSDLKRGVAVFQAQPGAVVQVSGEDKATGRVLDSVDAQYVFWDSHSRLSVAQVKELVYPETPFHTIVQRLRPSDWFTTQQAEFSMAFPDTPGRRSLSRYTRGNKVTALIDGTEYFGDLSGELTSVLAEISAHSGTTEYFWHVAGWGMETGVQITNRILHDYLESLRPAIVLLLWDNGYPFGDIKDKTKEAYELIAASAPTRALLDGKNHPLAAIHMKVVTIKKPTGLIAYCGGMDLVTSRLTDKAHENSRRTGRGFYGFLGQHDVQMKVQGPAASELDLVLYQRWADQRGDDGVFPPPTQDNTRVGSQVVQVARTVPRIFTTGGAGGVTFLSFAKDGDYTIRNTLLSALIRARQYIYIEDQYFTEGAIKDAVLSSLRNGLGFAVIVLPSVAFHRDVEVPNPTVEDKKPDELARELSEQFPDQVRVCYLENTSGEQIYVHAKVQIVDDVFVSCGSANLDVLGLAVNPLYPTSQECNIMVVDESVTEQGSREFVRDVRMKLWAEHLGLKENDPTLLDPTAAFERYWKKARPIHHLRFFPLP